MGEGISLIDKIRQDFNIKEVDIHTYSPLSLAFLGDVVYDLVIRSVIVGEGSRQSGKLHDMKSKLVMAPTQAKLSDAIMDELSEEEMSVYRRGRNSNPHSIAKSGSRAEYMKATGLETLMGYLYLAGKLNRAIELINHGLTILEGERI